MDYRELVYNLTMEYANKIISDGSKDLKVVFSNNLNGVNGSCYPFLKTIVYCDGYMKLNQKNLDVIKYTVIEECVHLIRLPHDEIFYKMCRDIGCDVSVPPVGIKYYWRYLKRCEKCGDGKYYNRKPRNIVCNKCGNNSILFEGVG